MSAVAGSERSVIAAMIRAEDRLYVAAQLASMISEADFSDSLNGIAFRVVAAIVTSGHPPTPTLIRERLADQYGKFIHGEGLESPGAVSRTVVTYLFAENPECRRNYILHAERIARASVIRRANMVSENIASLCRVAGENGDEANSLIRAIQEFAMSLTPINAIGKGKPTLLADLVPGHLKALEAEYKNKDAGHGLRYYDTGFPSLNRYTLGFGPGHMIVLAAKSGKGKSVMAVQLAEHLSRLNNKAVGHVFSFEMRERAMAERMLFARSQVRSDLYIAKNLPDSDWDKLRDASLSLCDLPIHLHDDPAMTVEGIGAYLRAERFKGNADFAVVDYTQIVKMDSSVRVGSPTERVEAIVSRLNDICKGVNIPLIALSQLNSVGEVKQAGKIREDADVLIILERLQEPKDVINPNIGGLFYKAHVDKCRHGSEGSFNLTFYPSQTRFEEVDDDIPTYG